jgi:pimeloyl-ACP methyl ester carboxylesterase
MAKAPDLHPADLVGLGRLATDAVAGMTDVVEAVHRQVAFRPGGLRPGWTTDITSLAYDSIRQVTFLVGRGLSSFTLLPSPATSSLERQAITAALNGVLGDYLAETGNPLAIRMSLRSHGRSLEIERNALRTALQPTGKVLLLVHGLCLNDLQWLRKRHDHGAALARELGYTPVYLRYNTGLHVSENGRLLAALIEALLEQWPEPVQELAIIGHSMGGLVSRSACHHAETAGQRWPRHLRKLVFLGTPHHGAPLERLGNWVNTSLEISPYTAPLARLGRIRSAGITDMRHGNLLEKDWKGHDRFSPAKDFRTPLPLPAGVHCYAIAATARRANENPSLDLLGDGLVPVNSALGRHHNAEMTLAFPASHQRIGYGIDHWDLLGDPAVYDQIRRWLGFQSETRGLGVGGLIHSPAR